MKALDTNILVYAEMKNAPQHTRALEVLQGLAQGPAAWAIPWPCIYEMLRVITHPRAFRVPIAPETALQDVKAILASPSLILLSETPLHVEILEQVVLQAGAKGNLMHDAHIVALCLEHGATELITADRDFARFRGLRITNPF
ncbi:MAG: PIN domain-containing protein [Acidobacteria bacterium]|nr:PIN domain-containing protein [Acidobacteriota bacterium]